MERTYSGLLRFSTFEERFEYLKLSGSVGIDTFGGRRWLNQRFYHSREWKQFRNAIILRDDGCDLGIIDRPIRGRVYIHHINPIKPEDLMHSSDLIMDPDNVVLVSFDTHNALHYGSYDSIANDYKERRPHDTCPWKEAKWPNQQETLPAF